MANFGAQPEVITCISMPPSAQAVIGSRAELDVGNSTENVTYMPLISCLGCSEAHPFSYIVELPVT